VISAQINSSGIRENPYSAPRELSALTGEIDFRYPRAEASGRMGIQVLPLLGVNFNR